MGSGDKTSIPFSPLPTPHSPFFCPMFLLSVAQSANISGAKTHYGSTFVNYGEGCEAVALNYVGLYFKPKIHPRGGWPLRFDAMEPGAGRRTAFDARSRAGIGEIVRRLLAADLRLSAAERLLSAGGR